jgi:hypothetical protein
MRGKTRFAVLALAAFAMGSTQFACGSDEVSRGGWTVEEGDGSKTDYGSDTVVVVTPGETDSSVIVTGDPDECIEVEGACIDLDQAKEEHGGQYCDDPDAQADVIVVDGEVEQVICYPPKEDGTDIREAAEDENGTTQVPQTESGTVVTFPEETDGEAIVGDVNIDAERTTLFGNGPDSTIIDGNLSVASNSSRVRGLTVTGDATYLENSNDSAISFCGIEGNLTVNSNNFSASNCRVFGDVSVLGNNAVLVNIGVQGAWEVAAGTTCAGCYSIDDADGDFVVEEGEVGEELACE